MVICTAAVAQEANKPFVLRTLVIEPPREDEVLVRIVGVGLCHTDLVFRDQMDAFPMPAVLGHEGAGIIEEVGKGVTGLAVGDQVVLGFSSCGDCPRCAENLPSYCNHFLPLNYAGRRLGDSSAAYMDGTRQIGSHFFGQSSFATYAVARARNAVKVDGLTKLPLELLGPLGCGLMTGAGAVMQSMDCKAGSTLLVLGGGPVGLAAVMAGKIRQSARIILVEPVSARRELGLELGATHVVDPAAGPLEDALRAIVPEGIDAGLDTTGIPTLVEMTTSLLASYGIMGLVGVPKVMGTTITISIGQLMTYGRRVVGIIAGDSDPHYFIPQLLKYHAEGLFPFDRLIKTFPLSAINEAVDAQARGDCVKAVLLP
jgi:aryl-alcohol dehydrogenase